MKILFLVFRLYYGFTFGYILNDELQIYETPENQRLYFNQIDFEIMVNDCFFIQSSLDMSIQEVKLFKKYNPYQFRFDIGLGFRYQFIEIGYHHYCVHPMKTYYIREYPNINYEGGREQVYIKFHGYIGE